MKRTFLLCSLLLTLWALPASAAETVTVTIPDYPCTIAGEAVDHQNSRYPLLSYKDVTYFPMTWDYCRALGVTSTWADSEGLFIAHMPSVGELPVYPTVRNARTQTAEIADYPIHINGKMIDNAQEEYPLLRFRNVTYFPLTWRYAREEFNWTVQWDENGLTLFSGWKIHEPQVIMEVYEVGDTSAKVMKYVSTAVLVDEAEQSYTNVSENFYYLLDYATDSLTEIPDESEIYNTWSANRYNQRPCEGEVEVVDGYIVYEGQILHEVQALLDGTATIDQIAAYGDCYDYGAFQVYHFTVYTDMAIPAPYTPKELYNYVKKDGQFIYINDRALPRLAVMGEDGSIYVNTVRYSGWKGLYSQMSDLYRVQPDGTVVYLNDLYTDYQSMELIGEAGGKAYLKCIWGGNYVPNPVSEPYQVSALNDGYFTFDGETLQKIAGYVYTDSDFVTPSGTVYGVFNWKAAISRIVG